MIEADIPRARRVPPRHICAGVILFKEVFLLLDVRICTYYNNIVEGRNNENTRITKAFEEK